jgi:hypothetical protein
VGGFLGEILSFSPGFRLFLRRLVALLLDLGFHLIDELVDFVLHACGVTLP